ncbi:MAG: hypothetical protein KZQ66_09550 [Candidatus Thiodiazotropha sp. (ex Lucinoma aequizonata)]|nr:hypothetical protein [Candidatus Thiodiazotropha sp. (ex Lucinoma aequizonata)]MCU7894750.1 hypothetical protein [Candidatus Thiodiazotropha sp. (ex Lucinoma aequizonata)]MCU7897939.1 hypothetical protein [Candidatus Thiodiazotropha sp. (ex Lucinoma aequizonata)]MCU7902208.1 hypothetical protein [Candidatus Thiodiazotropha sp. (ex Lucinoma aequizonata)]MCU7907508.1 hypothetical protein [Candidatus Thiodiazotropha sp. (ex Lucinoma aequizonata)]
MSTSIDAFVEAWGDMHTGLEMTDRLFTRMHREEGNIAVMFMVDMSGSTQGWVNEAERKALILLVESLESELLSNLLFMHLNQAVI